MFILDAEPKELTIVLILGPIHMDDLGKLKGMAGLGALGDSAARSTAQGTRTRTKTKTKDKKGGDQ